MSDSNRVAVRYIKESAWGTTPASALKELRITSENLKAVQTTTESQEIRSDRQLADLIRTGRSASGDLGFELSYGSLDEFLAAGLQSAWQPNTGLDGESESGTDLLENGVTQQSFTIEKQFTDISNAFVAFKGSRINNLSLNFALGSVANGSMSIMAKSCVPHTATVGNGAPIAAETSQVISVIDVVSVSEGGGGLTGVTEFGLQITNNLREQQQLGSDELFGVGAGGFRVSGTLVAHFASLALFQKFTSFAKSSIAISVADEVGNTYVFEVPSIRYNDAEISTPGVNQDVFSRMSWTAIMDTETSTMLRIARTAGSE